MIASLLPPLYVAGLYGALRLAGARGCVNGAAVIDVLMLNWLACEVIRHLVPGQYLPGAYLPIDAASALWLSLRVPGVCAALAGIFYIALIMFNSAFFFAHAFDEWTHWIGLSILGWFQLVCVTGGMMRNDLAKVSRRAATRMGLQRRMAHGDKEAEG